MTNAASRPAQMPIARPTVSAPPVVAFAPPALITTMLPHVAQRYAAITMMQPQNRYVLIAFSPPFTSTPMFSGVSIPRRARIANEKKVRFAGMWRVSFSPRKGFQPDAKDVADGCPFRSHTTPAKPIRKIAAEYAKNWTFTSFWVTRILRNDMVAL